MDDGDRFYARLGDRIREQRKARRITQEELARVLELNRTSVVNIERGRQRIAVHQLVRIADHLGCAPGDLIPSADEENLLTKRQRSKVDPDALKFVSGVAADAKRVRDR